MPARLRSLFIDFLWTGISRKIQAEKPYVIAVTGSVGKTSTKDAIAAVLEQSGRPVVKTKKSFNSDIGIPISLLGFDKTPENIKEWLKALWRAVFPPITVYKEQPYYVLEYGSDKPGDIDFLTRRLPAQIGVISQVAPVHLAAFADMEALVEEELAITRGLRRGGWLILNADDEHQQELITKEERVLTFSLKTEGQKITRKEGSFSLAIGKEEVMVAVSGKHQLYPILAAIAVGKHVGMHEKDILAGVANYQLPPGRGCLIEGRNSTTILDESYNSSPIAATAALETLSEIAEKRRKVAILGRMNELGPEAEKYHRKMGEAAAKKVDLLITVGEYANFVVEGAEKAGLAKAKIQEFRSPMELSAQLDSLIQAKDFILVKGSQNGVRLERIVKQLMAHPEQAETLLARQDPYWQAQTS